MNILDPRFEYVPALQTNILKTFYRHGFKQTTIDERNARQARQHCTGETDRHLPAASEPAITDSSQ